MIAVLGGVSALLSFAPRWPKERNVDFRFEDDASAIVRLDVSWSRADQAAGADPVSGSSFRFEPGHAPKIVHSTVHLADGSYALDITLERADRTTSIQRTVDARRRRADHRAASLTSLASFKHHLRLVAHTFGVEVSLQLRTRNCSKLIDISSTTHERTRTWNGSCDEFA